MTCSARVLNGRHMQFLFRALAKSSVTRACSRGLQTQVQDISREQREPFLRAISNSETLRNTMGYSLSFADESDNFMDLSSKYFLNMPDKRMQEQLTISQDQLRRQDSDNEPLDNAPLPRTLEDALRSTNRAIVITETSPPFRIVEVNTAWEGLCGYSFVECQGKTLGSLLGGPETDKSAVTAVVSQLLRGEEAGTVLTNYTKDGRKFRNRLRVGPLIDGDLTTHFVGVLQEIHDEGRRSSMQN